MLAQSIELIILGLVYGIVIYGLHQSIEPKKSAEDWRHSKEKWRKDRFAFFSEHGRLQALDTNEIDWSKFSLLLTWEFARERDLWIIPRRLE